MSEEQDSSAGIRVAALVRSAELARACCAALLVFAAACADICPSDVSPITSDPESVRQWHLSDVGALGAWSRTRGDGVVVAIVDNGFDLSHPELRDQLWVNTGEVPDNGVDDDGNGYVDDAHGWDFLDGDADASVLDSLEPRAELRAHGTAVAGIVAARTDDGVQIAGACPECRLMLLRGRDFVEERTVLPVLPEAIRYAIRNGAGVVSISDGRFAVDVDGALDAELRGALDEAEASGVVVVASAGNDGELGVRLPAAYPTVLAVASVGPGGLPSPYTSHGPEVDVAAPGDCIHTLDVDGGTMEFRGTSASAPLAAALGALVIAADPALTPAGVRARIRDRASPLDLAATPDLEGRLGTGVIRFDTTVAP